MAPNAAWDLESVCTPFNFPIKQTRGGGNKIFPRKLKKKGKAKCWELTSTTRNFFYFLFYINYRKATGDKERSGWVGNIKSPVLVSGGSQLEDGSFELKL